MKRIKRKNRPPSQGDVALSRATLRIPTRVWIRTLHAAIDQRVPTAVLVTRALDEYLRNLRKGGAA